jgi:RNAse (barnase) inhibitor barstar
LGSFDLSIDAIIRGHAAPQIYRLESDIFAPDLARLMTEANGKLFWLDGEKMAEMASLMAEFARVLKFPSYFGANWDALGDCLTDLSWLDLADSCSHLVLSIDHWDDCASPILQDILQEAVTLWADSEMPLYVLLRSDSLNIGNFLVVG